jgi:hypothetical protein
LKLTGKDKSITSSYGDTRFSSPFAGPKSSPYCNDVQPYAKHNSICNITWS